MTFYIILILSVFLLSLLSTRVSITTLRGKALFTPPPSLRRMDAPPVPRGGGFAVIMTLVIGLLIADMPFAIILSVLMLAAVSLMDELIGVPILVQWLVQLFSVLLPLAMIHAQLFGGLLSAKADLFVTALLWLGFIQLFKKMDGIHGMGASGMVSLGLGVALIAILQGLFPTPLSVYGLIIVAAGCGFVWWNWPPAKILFGSVGSVPVGFLLGYLLLLAALSGYGFAALILPAYYVSDVALTKVRNLYRPVLGYYYQRALAGGRKPAAVVRYVCGINVILILLATLSIIDSGLAELYLGLAYMSVFMMLGFFAHTPHNPHHEPF